MKITICSPYFQGISRSVPMFHQWRRAPLIILSSEWIYCCTNCYRELLFVCVCVSCKIFDFENFANTIQLL